ncbi:endopolyphosphatase [Entomortierella parvispora]|uniref:Endopolyphosphatase n=1 Tax=Entomortierella parvispora TaxID=205924 RepID=A0A9P3H276_9FUNG|nr:endopolyphosphatase [Entomortierella parvispora]
MQAQKAGPTRLGLGTKGQDVDSACSRRAIHRRILLCSVAVTACLLSVHTAAAGVAATSSSRPLHGRFLQITDIHPDEHYVDGAAIASSCHAGVDSPDDLRDFNKQRPGLASLSVLSSMTLDDGTTVPVGVGGFYGAPNSICDSPFALANATFDWIDQNLVDKIDFVVWTGDNARHDSDNTHPRTQDQINMMNNAIAKRFLEAFPISPVTGLRIPLVPSIGNNDVYPHNIMHPGPNPILQHYSNIWSEFIPDGQMNTFRRGGYYSSEVIPGKISVFGLNTLYFYIHNAAVDGCKDEDEPGTEQMDWLENELASLRKRRMVAYLTGHVPPEKKSYSPTCYKRYTQLALQYQDVIVGHLYGHANIDHFFLLGKGKKSKKAVVATTTTRTRKTVLVETLSGDEEEIEDIRDIETEIIDYEDSEEDDDEEEEEEDENEDVSDKIDVLEEEDNMPFHPLGLSTYLEDLWKQYSSIPKKAKLDKYAIVQVSPSVIPTYYPTLRVFSYQLLGADRIDQDATAPEPDNLEDMREKREERFQQELEQYFADQLNKDLPWDNSDFPTWGGEDEDQDDDDDDKRKPPKVRHPQPVPVSTFGFPLSFTQYWSNITLANLDPDNIKPEFVVEYHTRDDYGLQDLSVASWLDLARKISKDKDLKATYLARMVVQTGAESLLSLND